MSPADLRATLVSIRSSGLTPPCDLPEIDALIRNLEPPGALAADPAFAEIAGEIERDDAAERFAGRMGL